MKCRPEGCHFTFAAPRLHHVHQLQRLNFDTSGFLEDPKLTRKQRDLRQKMYEDKRKNQRFLYFWSTNTSICTLEPPLGLKCSRKNSITPKSSLQLSNK